MTDGVAAAASMRSGRLARAGSEGAAIRIGRKCASPTINGGGATTGGATGWARPARLSPPPSRDLRTRVALQPLASAKADTDLPDTTQAVWQAAIETAFSRQCHCPRTANVTSVGAHARVAQHSPPPATGCPLFCSPRRENRDPPTRTIHENRAGCKGCCRFLRPAPSQRRTA